MTSRASPERVLSRRAMLATLAVSAAAIGCPKAISPPLRIGPMWWPPYEIFELASRLGYYPSGAFQLVDFGSHAEAQRAYEGQVLDAVCTTAEYALQLLESSRDHRIVLVIDFSNGGDALVARRGIRQIAELRGKRVGLEAASLGSYVLTRALERAQLTKADVVLAPLDFIDHQHALLNGQVDAVVTYEPVREKVIAEGGNELFTSKEIPREVIDVLIVRASLLETRVPLLRKLVDGWFRAADYITKNPVDGARRLATRQGMTVDAFLRALRGTELPSLEENRRLLAGPTPSLDPLLRRLSELAAQQGIIRRPVDPSSLLDDRLVRAANT